MRKWIRWWGLLSFLGIIAIFAILWFLLIDGWIERAIETGGSRLVGAKVELDSADLSLFPAGLTLNRLQITDPEKPMTNAAEVGRIVLTVDTLNLLRRKLIVKKMTVDGVRFNTPRTSSGALTKVKRKEKRPEGGKSASAIPFTMPDVKEILKKERLRSLEEIDALNKDISARKAKWQNRLSKLPDKSTFKKYEKRIEEIKKGSKGIDVITEILDLQKEMESQIRELETADTEFSKEIKSLKQQVKDIKNVQEKDIKRISDTYRFGGKGLSGISGILFGLKIGGYVDTALRWYGRVRPVIERKKEKSGGVVVIKPIRGKGVNVRFREHAPLPDLLIRTARASIQLKDGEVSGTITNITPDQDILGKPTVFSFSGKEIGNAGALEITGSLDHIRPDASKDTVNVVVKRLGLRDVTLSGDGGFPVSLGKGITDIALRAEVSGNAISSTLKADITGAQFTTKEKPSSAVEKAVISVLKDISAISIKAGISGTTDNYDVKVSSNIDGILKRAADKEFKKARDLFESRLRSEIEGRVKEPLNNTVGSFGELVIIDKEIGSRLNYATGILKNSGKKPSGVLERYLQ